MALQISLCALCVAFIALVAASDSSLPKMKGTVTIDGMDFGPFPNAFQTYVATPDPIYSYNIVGTRRQKSSTTYMINQTSFHWLTQNDSTTWVWWNMIQLTVPDKIVNYPTNWAVIYADGGDVTDGVPTSEDLFGVIMAETLGVPAAHLLDIPNEPVAFYAEGYPLHYRSEDAIIAYCWVHYFYDTNEPEWLPRFPMVKAVVRTMDTIQDFMTKKGLTVPQKFVVAGASKRGWTTWLTPAVDTRVGAIVPISMPIPNTHAVIGNQWEAYGAWTFAFSDYISMNVPNYFNTQQFKMLAGLVDPMSYLPYLAKVPKYVILGTADEFFTPDSPRHWMPTFIKGGGETVLRIAPNFDHPMIPSPDAIINNILAWANLLFKNQPRPTLTETIVYSNTTAAIRVLPSVPPKSATLWRCHGFSAIRRDFRFIWCGNATCFQPNFWYATPLTANQDGSYSAEEKAPSYGWTGFVIELTYESDVAIDMTYELTSEVNIVPDRYPYPKFQPPANPFSPTPTSG